MDKCPKLFCFFIFVLLVDCHLYLHVADSAPIKLHGLPNESNENNEAYQHNEYPSKYSGIMKNKSTTSKMKIERDNDIPYAIPKRRIKWNIRKMDL